MTKTMIMASAVLAIAASASPAAAVTNLIKNGSFEQGGFGSTGFISWTKTNTPTGSLGQGDEAARVIGYNIGGGNSAYGEVVGPDSIPNSGSPDAVGNQAAYFVGDRSVDEAISQLTYLSIGNYRVGFSYYLPANGLSNSGNSSFSATILGVPVASTMINGASVAQTWFYASGVGQITRSGYYNTAFVFNSNAYPSKDIVIDRVFAVATTDPADVVIPPTDSVPEPTTWALLIIGFGMVGITSRRRSRGAVAA